MTLDEIRAFLNDNPNNPDLDALIEELYPVDPERVKDFLTNSPEGQDLLQRLTDQRVTAAVKTFEENFLQNKLPAILEEEINRRFPAESNEEKRARELQDRISRLEEENRFSELRNFASTVIAERGLPFFKLTGLLIGADEEETLANIELLQELFDEAVSEAVTDRFKENGRAPEQGPAGQQTIRNPWSPEYFNLTEQGRLMQENPELAEQLRSAAV